MQLHWYAKIFGWAQFGVMLAAQVLSQNPHGAVGWLTTIGSGLAGLGIHVASNTGGPK